MQLDFKKGMAVALGLVLAAVTWHYVYTVDRIDALQSRLNTFVSKDRFQDLILEFRANAEDRLQGVESRIDLHISGCDHGHSQVPHQENLLPLKIKGACH